MAVDFRTLAYGAVVSATVSDRNGKNWKNRSLVVISPTWAIKQDEKLVLVCITGEFDDSAQYVRVPWKATPGGHPATKLTKDCRAACHWLRELDPFDIDEVRGFMPPSVMAQIETIVRTLNPDKLTDPKKPILPGTITPKGQQRNG